MNEQQPAPTDPNDRIQRSQVVLGTAAVYLGAGILILAGCEAFGGHLPGLPRSWYVNRTLWIGIGILLIPIGTALQAGLRTDEKGWQPTVPGRRFQHVRVYSREGCHLCDEALEVLGNPAYRSYLPVPEVIDIDDDPVLQERFGLLVPVVELDGEIRFKGHLNASLLRRLIEGTNPL